MIANDEGTGPAPGGGTARRARHLRALDSDDDLAAELVERTYREHSARLWRAVRAFSGDPDVASDAVAEAFAQLIRRGDAVNDPAAWVWRTAFRIAAGDLKSRRAFVEEERMGTPASPAGSDTVDLLRALAQLSLHQRQAVVLHDYAGFPARQAAAMVGSTEAAMRVHLMRGRRRLRVLLAG